MHISKTLLKQRILAKAAAAAQPAKAVDKSAINLEALRQFSNVWPSPGKLLSSHPVDRLRKYYTKSIAQSYDNEPPSPSPPFPPFIAFPLLYAACLLFITI